MTAPVWSPRPGARASQMADFARFASRETGRDLTAWPALHAFSIEDVGAFWSLLLAWSGVATEGSRAPALEGEGVEAARFFPHLRLSWAATLLAGPEGASLEAKALVAVDETGARRELTRGELGARVLALADALRARGVGAGDRVVALARNGAEAAIACLATAAIGAVWSSAAPDLGVDALVDRFGQLDPVLLFASTSLLHQGVATALAPRVAGIIDAVASIREVVWLDDGEAALAARPVEVSRLSALVADAPRADVAARVAALPRHPFAHPLFVLYSSGTTGRPKAIVHGTGGTLLEHVKEHRLHGDLRASDVLLFVTSTGWMMWPWLLSALAAGAAIVLVDGSVTYPDDDALWRVVEREGVTVLGTSPAYLGYCRDLGLSPGARATGLRAVMSTGSVLSEGLFHWVREHVGDVPLQSVSGGTDMLGCFVLGHPDLPVWPGEMQCVGLGFDLCAAAPDGTLARVGEGELVCASPFPSRPVAFVADTDGARLHEAYYAQHPGVWTHGDLVELTARGTARIHGRSDGVLNVRGIRVGPAEIYRVVARFDEVAEAMALEQAAPAEPGGSRLVLLVVMRPGRALDRPLTLRMKKELRDRASMAHVPAVVAEVPELPTTWNGKRSERAARDALHGRPLQNLAALRNPACLAAIAEHPALKLDA